MKIKTALSLIISLAFSCCASEEKPKPTTEAKAETKGGAKVLYVTHEPGQYHDYTGQRKIFEKIAAEQTWETTILSETYDGLLKRFAEDEEFAKGYDVVVYNICMATTKNTLAAHNIMKQTKDHGVNALLVHGALHSFWPTYNPKRVKPDTLVAKGLGKGEANKTLVAEWAKEHPDKDFPVWGDFCGCASIRHAKKSPIKVKKLIQHEAAAGVPDSYKTGNSELYLTYYKMKDVSEILEGRISKKDVAPILWEMPYEKSKVMAFTLGHFTEEWETPEFQSVFVESINYLAKKEAPSK